MYLYKAAIKKRLLATLASIIGLTTTALAVVQLSFSYQPQLIDGDNSDGFVGSTWSFDITLAQNSYSAFDNSYPSYLAGQPYALVDTATLTVTGASVPTNNGVFPIVDGNGSNLIVIPNHDLNDRVYFLESDGDEHVNFQFGTSEFSILLFSEFNPVVPMSEPGDFIQAEHFNGLTFDPAWATYGGPEATFRFPAGTTVSAVPEPGTWAAMIGLAGFGMAIYYTARRAEKKAKQEG